jgi:trk system potassium uptake protein TrkH
MPALPKFRRGLLGDWSPPTLFVASFAALILVGTVGLLALPGLYVGEPLGPLSALFTMTSAVCVTGLSLVDTATYFTFWGQAWLLLFIQLGGLGLITLSSAIILAMGRRLSLRTEMVAMTAPAGGQRAEIRALTIAVLRFTAVVEAIGAAVLFVLWSADMPPGQALWHAVFHSISAFCNAGFSTFSDSLMNWRDRPAVLATIASLILIGGMGFYTIGELGRWRRHGSERRPRLSSHSFGSIGVTLLLLAAGMAMYAAVEWNEAFFGLGYVDRLVNAFFLSVTARTAGFNTIDYSTLGNDAAFLTIMLMFVGGAPGSTAGGVKTTTLAVLMALAWSRLRGRRFVELHGRGVPEDTLERTVSLTLLAVAVLTIAVLLLNALHQSGTEHAAARMMFLPIVFEAVSAFGTVGLSMGMTDRLGDAGTLVLIVLMFVGRVGLLSFFAAVSLSRGRPRAAVRPAQEDLLVG